MNTAENLSIPDARKLFIQSQFHFENKTASDKTGLYNVIEQLGYIQIDTISVVERSHHHILWTRMPSYKKNMLEELMEKDKTVFEYWSHAAAYLPMKDFRFSLPRKKNYSERYKSWGKANRKIINYVYERIVNEGAMQSKDFEDRNSKSSGWWDWKPSKDALDFLFHAGKLMIAKRKGFQKVYDLTERILPEKIDTTFPAEKEYYIHLIENSIRANGLVSKNEITYQRRYDKKKFEKIINELTDSKMIMEVNIAGLQTEKYFTTSDKLKLLNQKNPDFEMNILSPFDNLIIQRKRLKNFFGFDYTIECYLPESKRKFGYFCMPVFYKDRFIARVDAKADRASGKFIIKKIFWEDNLKLNRKGLNEFEDKIYKMAEFTGCNKVTGLTKKNLNC